VTQSATPLNPSANLVVGPTPPIGTGFLSVTLSCTNGTYDCSIAGAVVAPSADGAAQIDEDIESAIRSSLAETPLEYGVVQQGPSVFEGRGRTLVAAVNAAIAGFGIAGGDIYDMHNFGMALTCAFAGWVQAGGPSLPGGGGGILDFNVPTSAKF
jgi:hypothetical protein